MPNFNRYTRSQLDFVLKLINNAIYQVLAPLEIHAWRTPEPVSFEQRRSGEALHLVVGDPWGKLFDCAWFNFTGSVPAEAAGQHLVLLIDVSGELCVVDAQGEPLRGLTNAASDFDVSLGGPGKCVFPVSEHTVSGEKIDIWADAGCNDLFGNLRDNGTVMQASIAVCREEVRQLFYDFEVLLDFLNVLPEDSAHWRQVNDGLHQAANSLAPEVTPEKAAAARHILQPLLQAQGGDPSLCISAIGHAHIDLVWLWPERESKRKGARTFATALANMALYPDYIFGASQPQLFQWIKDQYPALYARVKQSAAEGRFEVQGAMWVEADSNLTSGESLVRQLLYGKRFFRQEFGVEMNYLWLPDAFGYSGALPQILKKSGVEYFMTQKISWNLINTFPHQSFRWQGIDGSSVLAHMLPEETYNSPALPRSLSRIDKNYRDAGVSDRALLLFGIGDGGGGPGEEHLERLERLRNLAGLLPVAQEPAAVFFKKWAEDAESFATWNGELYLERHQGTLTTEAKNKWYNRKIEQALRELEWNAALAHRLDKAAYPGERLEMIWKEVLFYQFHDCLPGSSIKRVYDECLPRYQTLLAEVETLLGTAQQALVQSVDTSGKKSPVVVINSLSWERKEWIKIGDHWQKVSALPSNCTVVDAALNTQDNASQMLFAAPEQLENDLLRVRFNPDGTINSVFDKLAQREVIAAGQAANQFAVYHDPGNAWDFPMDYADQTPRRLQLMSAQAHLDGPRAVLKQVYRMGFSELRQEIVLTLGSSRLEFHTWLHWREAAAMLRTSFPVAVHADEATYEIQFGSIRRPTHRNTTWDLAHDEVMGHKWADLSQRDYGVALLNDSKYGHKIKDNVIDLNLLRSVIYPRPPLEPNKGAVPGEPCWGYTDQTDHIFSYALYPHTGDYVAGRVVQAAYEFNLPLRWLAAAVHPGIRPQPYLAVEDSNLIIETVKNAEDGSGLVVRLYESAGAGICSRLHFGFAVASAEETDLLEENPHPLQVEDNSVALEFRPFEIKTVKVA
jgi:alpha-mannosidase